DNREAFFYLLTHNVRITRELNNFNNEKEVYEEKIPIRDKEKYLQLIYECDDLFRENLRLLKQTLYPALENTYDHIFPEEGLQSHTPNDAQMVYVEKLLLELEFFRDGLQERRNRLKLPGIVSESKTAETAASSHWENDKKTMHTVPEKGRGTDSFRGDDGETISPSREETEP